MLDYQAPPNIVHAKETFDFSTQAIHEMVTEGMTRVVAEARIVAQVSTKGPAMEFLKRIVLARNQEWLSSLGDRLSFCSVKFEVPGRPSSELLDSPRREFTIEVLREDPGCLFLQLVSTWTQIPPIEVQPGVPLPAPDLTTMRQIGERPSDYVQEAYACLEKSLTGLQGLEEGSTNE